MKFLFKTSKQKQTFIGKLYHSIGYLCNLGMKAVAQVHKNNEKNITTEEEESLLKYQLIESDYKELFYSFYIRALKHEIKDNKNAIKINLMIGLLHGLSYFLSSYHQLLTISMEIKQFLIQIFMNCLKTLIYKKYQLISITIQFFQYNLLLFTTPFDLIVNNLDEIISLLLELIKVPTSYKIQNSSLQLLQDILLQLDLQANLKVQQFELYYQFFYNKFNQNINYGLLCLSCLSKKIIQYKQMNHFISLIYHILELSLENLKLTTSSSRLDENDDLFSSIKHAKAILLKDYYRSLTHMLSCLSANQFDTLLKQYLQQLLIHYWLLYHNLFDYEKYMSNQSYNQLLYMLYQQNIHIFDDIFYDVCYVALLKTIFYYQQSSADKLIKYYQQLWYQMIIKQSHDVYYQQHLFNILMISFLKLMETYDLRIEQQQPKNRQHYQSFLYLIQFMMTFLTHPVVFVFYYKKWNDILLEKLIELSLANPLISGFYKLIKLILQQKKKKTKRKTKRKRRRRRGGS